MDLIEPVRHEVIAPHSETDSRGSHDAGISRRNGGKNASQQNQNMTRLPHERTRQFHKHGFARHGRVVVGKHSYHAELDSTVNQGHYDNRANQRQRQVACRILDLFGNSGNFGKTKKRYE